MHLNQYVSSTTATLEDLPLSKIDVLALTWLTYFDMRPIADRLPLSFAELKDDPYAAELEQKHESFIPNICANMFRTMMVNPRYRDFRIIAYQHQVDASISLQFGALAIDTGKQIVVAYEGTDLSFNGWKEDCIMSYSDSIASYPLAKGFLEEVLRITDRPLILAGHSKGGNVAAYCLATYEDDSRIEAAYSFEGPGFHNPQIFAAYPERTAKLQKFIPQSAVVGVMLCNEAQVRIVRSDSVGVFQHNAFKWIIKEGDFVYLAKTTASSRYIDRAVNGWIDSLTETERAHFVDLCFDGLQRTKVKRFPELLQNIFKEMPALRENYMNLGKEDKAFIKRAIRSLAQSAFFTLGEGVRSLFNRNKTITIERTRLTNKKTKTES